MGPRRAAIVVLKVIVITEAKVLPRRKPPVQKIRIGKKIIVITGIDPISQVFNIQKLKMHKDTKATN